MKNLKLKKLPATKQTTNLCAYFFIIVFLLEGENKMWVRFE